MADEDTVFAILLYKFDAEKGQLVVADDPSFSGEPYCEAYPSPDGILDLARNMIFRTFVREFKEKGHTGIDQNIEAMQKAADSAEAKLVRLPRDAGLMPRLYDDIGFMMSQFFVPGGDWSEAIGVKALVVKMSRKASRRYTLEDTQRKLLPAVNNPEPA